MFVGVVCSPAPYTSIVIIINDDDYNYNSNSNSKNNNSFPAHAELGTCWTSLISLKHLGIVALADMLTSTIHLPHLYNSYSHAIFSMHSLRA